MTRQNPSRTRGNRASKKPVVRGRKRGLIGKRGGRSAATPTDIFEIHLPIENLP